MLHSISIKGCFSHQDTTLPLMEGLTAITGPNGTGKSLVLEMIRFALFGSQALRTVAEDYKGVKVALDFEVRGVAYRVERTTTTAKLYRTGTLVVSGTRPVNTKIVETFGYGLDVFDVANVANQGAIEALSAMKPAERKRLVDSTVGLNLLDDLATWCATEAQARGREASAMRGALTEPTPPVKPLGYRPSDDLAPERDRLVARADEWRVLGHRIVAIPADIPMPNAPDLRDLGTLKALAQDSKTCLQQLMNLREQERCLTLTIYTAEVLAACREMHAQCAAYREARGILATYEGLTLSLGEIKDYEQALSDHEDYMVWRALADKGTHTCPSCSHTWYVQQDAMGDRKQEPPPIMPWVTRRELNKQKQLHIDRERDATRVANATLVTKHPPPPEPGMSLEQVAKYEKHLGTHAQRVALQEAILDSEARLDAIPHVTEAMIQLRASYEKSLLVWDRVQDLRQELPALLSRRSDLEGALQAAEAISLLLTEVQVYDRMQAHHEEALVAYVEAMAKAATLEAQRTQLSRARTALGEIKGRVKQYLVPSLSRVASGLLSRMTGGALASIVVSENFDITVDGVSIDGLSGAGKAAANLALRIGLGQVLTNKVFSVFLGDELDASMDAERVDLMAQCFRGLSSTISQVILVSHKNIDADNSIFL